MKHTDFCFVMAIRTNPRPRPSPLTSEMNTSNWQASAHQNISGHTSLPMRKTSQQRSPSLRELMHSTAGVFSILMHACQWDRRLRRCQRIFTNQPVPESMMYVIRWLNNIPPGHRNIASHCNAKTVRTCDMSLHVLDGAVHMPGSLCRRRNTSTHTRTACNNDTRLHMGMVQGTLG